VRNEKECVCSVPNCCDTEQRSASNIHISGKIIKEMPGSVASGTPSMSFCAVHYSCEIQSLDLMKKHVFRSKIKGGM